MFKITRLYLKNFAPIYSAMGKYEVLIDLSNNDRVINMFVGAIGSGKTFIMSMLQPFHGVGTLDIRSSDNLIIEGKSGEKQIDYLVGDDVYEIQHKYNLVGKSYTNKSFVQKNGEELNPNGNQNSFREIIERDFGLDPMFLRMIRLGPNVSNIINMKATERKQFIASLLKDTEIYTLIHKKLTDKYRSINGTISHYTDKLMRLGEKDLNRLEESADELESLYGISLSKYEEVKSKLAEVVAETRVLTNGLDFQEYFDIYTEETRRSKSFHETLSSMREELLSLDQHGTEFEIAQKLGELGNKKSSLQELIMTLENEFQQTLTDRNKLVHTLSLSGNETALMELETEYQNYLTDANEMKERLKNFKCDKTSVDMENYLSQCREIDGLLDSLIGYDTEILKTIYRSDSSILSVAAKKKRVIFAKKLEIQKRINNVSFAATYELPIALQTPPSCPTSECPYRISHPGYIKHQTKGKVDKEVENLRNQLDKLDREYYVYEEYPNIYSLINRVRQLFNFITKGIGKYHLITISNVLDIIINSSNRNWYNVEEFQRMITMCGNREKYQDIMASIKRIDAELSNMRVNMKNELSIKSELTKLDEKITETKNRLNETSSQLTTTAEEYTRYQEIYDAYLRRAKLQNDMKIIEMEMKSLDKSIETKTSTLSAVDENERLRLAYLNSATSLEKDINKYSSDLETVRILIRDIKVTRAETDSLVDKRDLMKLILDASSTKEGIPLVMIRLFLDACVAILNELVADVFGDVLEIINFNITDTDFKIPYTINGMLVDDIEKASQGQQAIISIALSFALIREASLKYNIMLLDELDGPLHYTDRQKFIDILMKQMGLIGSSQVFLITHNDLFNNFPMNVILTSDENVDNSLANVIRV